jgi:hypothetical protein
MLMVINGQMWFITARLSSCLHGQSWINGQDYGHQIIRRLSMMHSPMVEQWLFGSTTSLHFTQMIDELCVGFTKVKIQFHGLKEKVLL